MCTLALWKLTVSLMVCQNDMSWKRPMAPAAWSPACHMRCHRAKSSTKKKSPAPTICRIMGRSMMWLFGWRGRSRITRLSGGSDESAMAAKVSMMRFTHSICVTLSGESRPMKAPASTMRQAQMLMVIWKRRKRLMFL